LLIVLLLIGERKLASFGGRFKINIYLLLILQLCILDKGPASKVSKQLG